MRLSNRKLWVLGTPVDVVVENFPGRDILFGYHNGEDRIISVGHKHEDDATFLHEILHDVMEKMGVSLSESQIDAMSIGLFSTFRDPRNAWIKDYLMGDSKK